MKKTSKGEKPEISELEELILKKSALHWFDHHTGISALDFCKEFDVTNKEIMVVMERLVQKELGTINKKVALYQISLRIGKKVKISNGRKRITHIFFPCKSILEKYFYASDISKADIPEYEKRLHLGANQISLAYFSEEVLKRYFDHPRSYIIEDTLAGGSIHSQGSSDNKNYLYVRYGKRLVNRGTTLVAALFVDLGKMSADEQSYWSSFEVKEFIPDRNDGNFQRFLANSYDGEPVHFPDIFMSLAESIDNINTIFAPDRLFNTNVNPLLRQPVENTRKAFCDSCSELYKLIGPDNISSSSINSILVRRLKL
ncbi:MAG TPA: hypothetical protein VK141_06245, partial [Nitrosomonas sp.]|nr:hypothetical protein [Nitrosomonas sp.]